MDLGRLVGVVFINLKKAMDTVDHEILCRKLDLYGVHQSELSCLNPTYLIVNSSVGLTVLTLHLGK